MSESNPNYQPQFPKKRAAPDWYSDLSRTPGRVYQRTEGLRALLQTPPGATLVWVRASPYRTALHKRTRAQIFIRYQKDIANITALMTKIIRGRAVSPTVITLGLDVDHIPFNTLEDFAHFSNYLRVFLNSVVTNSTLTIAETEAARQLLNSFDLEIINPFNGTYWIENIQLNVDSFDENE